MSFGSRRNTARRPFGVCVQLRGNPQRDALEADFKCKWRGWQTRILTDFESLIGYLKHINKRAFSNSAAHVVPKNRLPSSLHKAAANAKVVPAGMRFSFAETVCSVKIAYAAPTTF